jgi:polar amino acid transport system substrate-binding protein
VLKLATTPWCPYTCGKDDGDFGFIGIYMREIFSQLDTNIHIKSYPWSRAIKLANSGDVDGLLTAAHSEAPDLLFTDTPITHYQVCFFTLHENAWHYNNQMLFGDNILGVIQDYGYGEPLDSFIRTNNKHHLVSISGSDSINRLLAMLIKKRVDVIAQDLKVLSWLAKEESINIDEVKQSGCLSPQPFYLALSSNNQNRKIINQLNVLLSHPDNLKRLNELSLSYQKLK